MQSEVVAVVVMRKTLLSSEHMSTMQLDQLYVERGKRPMNQRAGLLWAKRGGRIGFLRIKESQI
jgi:hypothetical protein